MTLPPVAPMPGNLPSELGVFVGRHQALAEGRRLLASARLVTLTGPGGIGKTRLALRLAAETSSSVYPDGVWLISLGALDKPEELTAALAAALGLQLRNDVRHDNLDVVLKYLRTRRLLLVVDNCEHLVDTVNDVLRRVLQAAAGVRVLATSRTPLQVPGEHLQPVRPLGTDDEGQCEAVQLLKEQARVVNAELGDGDIADAVRLCRLLDGVPLAITLAAARLPSVGITDLVDRIAGGRYGLLDTGQHHGQPWHRTMAANLDWSYELCSSAEQHLWDCLSVFTSGFDSHSAETVCADAQLDAAQVPRLLVSLVDQSVLQADVTGGTARYRMLDSVRAAGAARLSERAQEEHLLRQAHAEHYLDLARKATDAIDGDHEIDWMRRVQLEMPHFHAAVDWFLGNGQQEQSLDLAVELAQTRSMLFAGHLDQIRGLLQRTLDALTRPHALQVAGHVLAARVDLCLGHTAQADDELAAADATARQLNNPPHLEPWLLIGHGLRLLADSNPSSLAALRQAHHAWQQHADPDATYPGRDFLPVAAALLGDATTAQRDIECHTDAGGAVLAQAWTQWCRGVTELRHGSPHSAAELLAATTHQQISLGDTWGSAWSLEALAWASAACWHNEQAAVLLGAAHQQRLPTVTMTGIGPAADLHDQWVTTTRARLGAETFDAAFEHGTALDHAGLLAYLQDLPDPAQHSEQQPGGLSEREYEIAGLIAAGLTNRQIAGKLFVSPRTVDTHGESIRHKLGISGHGARLEIARWWGQHQDQR